MTTLDRPITGRDAFAAELERELNQSLALTRQIGAAPLPPRVRISLKRLASGEWQPDYSVESFDADPATDTGYQLIARRLMDTDSLVRQQIKQFADRDETVPE